MLNRYESGEIIREAFAYSLCYKSTTVREDLSKVLIEAVAYKTFQQAVDPTFELFPI